MSLISQLKNSVFLDTETLSVKDVTRHGAEVHARDPYGAMRLITYKLGSEPTQVWAPELNPTPPDVLCRVLTDPGIPKWAWNAPFDYRVLKHLGPRVGLPKVDDPSSFHDASDLAAYFNIPVSLERAAEALGLRVRKQADGKALIRLFGRPKGATNKNPMGDDPRVWVTPDEKPDEWNAYVEYAIGDTDVLYEAVRTMAEAFTWPERERRIARTITNMNYRGVGTDNAVARAFVDISAVYADRAVARAEKMTGLRPTQVKAITERYGFPDLSMETVDGLLLRPDLPSDQRALLEARQMVNRAAPKKAQAILDREVDGRLHDGFIYAGTHTHRCASPGAQLQNFPRGVLSYSDVDMLLEVALRYDPEKAADLLETLFADVGEAMSSAMRSLLIAADGKILRAEDLSKIELAMLWHMAGEREALARLMGGADEYKRFAAEVMFGLPSVDHVTKDHRQAAKASVLGCGFQLGIATFMLQTGLPEDIARLGVFGYRRGYPLIPKFWHDIEEAAVQAWRTQSRVRFVQDIPSIAFQPGPMGTLMLTKPSGSAMYYHKPKALPFMANGRRGYKLQYQQVKDGRFVTKDSYGGLLTEHICSSTARDLMMHSATLAESRGYDPVLMVHDELVCEVDPTQVSQTDVRSCLLTTESWARGWPVDAEGGSDVRYRKF